MASYHLAQANFARMLAPLDDPLMQGFVSQLDAVNAAADAAPGFVWRMQTEDGDATGIRAFEDERILFNMSVWESLDALREYVYQGIHRGPLRDRGQWFETHDAPSSVLWWIPAGHEPTIEEARGRLDALAAHGPGPEAFTFRRAFPSPA